MYSNIEEWNFYNKSITTSFYFFKYITSIWEWHYHIQNFILALYFNCTGAPLKNISKCIWKSRGKIYFIGYDICGKKISCGFFLYKPRSSISKHQKMILFWNMNSGHHMVHLWKNHRRIFFWNMNLSRLIVFFVIRDMFLALHHWRLFSVVMAAWAIRH